MESLPIGRSPKMRCIACRTATATRVTRSLDNGETVRRRRECLECKTRFTTFEVIIPRVDADERMNRAAVLTRSAAANDGRIALHAIRKDLDDDQLPLL